MYDELFVEGMPIKRELRLLAKTLRNTTLITALEYIDKLEVQLVTNKRNPLESPALESSRLLRESA